MVKFCGKVYVSFFDEISDSFVFSFSCILKELQVSQRYHLPLSDYGNVSKGSLKYQTVSYILLDVSVKYITRYKNELVVSTAVMTYGADCILSKWSSWG